MAYLGRWEIDDLLTFPANTHAAATGAATDADSAPSYRVYEDETSTPILTGSMALLDSSNTAGFYTEQITLSTANGFEVGKSYTIYISATVSSVTGTMSHTFQVEAALATASALATVDANVDTLVASITTTDALVDAVFDEATAGHTTAGSFGKLLVDNINQTISSRATQTSVDDLPTNAELTTALAAADDAVLASVATRASQASVDTIDDFLDTEIAALTTAVADLPTNAELATALGTADDATLAAIAALNNLSAAQVNAEVLDVLTTDTFAEPSAVPNATSSIKDKLNWLFALARNKIIQSSTQQRLRNDADSGNIAQSTVSDDGSEAIRNEWT